MRKILFFIFILSFPLFVYAEQPNMQSYLVLQPNIIYNKNVYQQVNARNIQLPPHITPYTGTVNPPVNLNKVTITSQTIAPQNISIYLTQKTEQTYPFLKVKTYYVPINLAQTKPIGDNYFLKDSNTTIVVRTNNKNKLKGMYHISLTQVYIPTLKDDNSLASNNNNNNSWNNNNRWHNNNGRGYNNNDGTLQRDNEWYRDDKWYRDRDRWHKNNGRWDNNRGKDRF